MFVWQKSAHVIRVYLAIFSLLSLFVVQLALTTNVWGREDKVITLDSGVGLVVDIKTDHATSSLRGPGDIISMRYEGVDYQDPLKGSHINSGFRGLYNNQGGVFIHTGQQGDVTWVSVQAGFLTHYYMMRRGQNILYMGTYFTQEPRLNLVRFIARIPHSLLPGGIEAAQITDSVRCIEAHDIFAQADGQTRSKHYSNQRLIDWHYFGAKGQNVGIWFVRDNNEGGSGGPFYRSLREQGAKDQELTYIVNYGEAQTQEPRLGILNRYALVFNHGEAPPSQLDMRWQEALHLQGLIESKDRGRISGHAPLDIHQRAHYVVGLSGPQGQYWGIPHWQTGQFTIDNIRPGNYTATLYKNELALTQREVSIKAGKEAIFSMPISSRWYDRPAFWRIGQWDGTPLEFKNGQKLTTMHPSDPRMASWENKGPFRVEAYMPWDFPACQWQDVNNDLHVLFPMEHPPTRDVTLRIGITDAFMHGRPVIEINGWHSSIPRPTEQPKSRTLTVGTYRGNNATFTYKIPQSVIHQGENDLVISVASGSHGHGFLSPGYAFDALEMTY